MAFKSPPPGRGGQNQAPLGPFPVPDQPSSLAIDLALALGGLGSGIAGEPSILGAVERRLANLEQRAQEAEAANIAQGLQREAKAEERAFTEQSGRLLKRHQKSLARFNRQTQLLVEKERQKGRKTVGAKGTAPGPLPKISTADERRMDDLSSFYEGVVSEFIRTRSNPDFSWPRAVYDPQKPGSDPVVVFNDVEDMVRFIEDLMGQISGEEARRVAAPLAMQTIQRLRLIERQSAALTSQPAQTSDFLDAIKSLGGVFK